MMPRARRALALALTLVGVGLLGYSTAGYLRAEQFRREATIAPAPPAESGRSRPARGDAIALLEIPRLRVCVPIVEGDGDAELDRAAGHLPDTPLPWEAGNAAIAGHRDTVFRPLARVRAGDVIRVTTPGARYDYAVRDTRVVEPDDLSVLEAGPVPALTLITCYPFRFVGPAPQRFVVRAERIAAGTGQQQDCRDGRWNTDPSR